MALRAIRINNDPILKRPCREVPQVDDRVRQLLDDMLETLHATANGAAIATPSACPAGDSREKIARLPGTIQG